MGIAVTHEPVGEPLTIVRDDYNDDQHVVELSGALAAIDGIGTGLAGKIARFLGDNSAEQVAVSDFVAALLASADGPTLLTAIGALAKAGGVMTGNIAMGGNSITGLAAPSGPADAAPKSYVDALATVVSGALVFKGDWNASSGIFPGSGAAKTGWFYKVGTAGTTGGVAFTEGDDIYAVADNASSSTYAGNWLQVSGNITLAEIQSIVGFTFGSLAAQSSVTASQISDATANGRSLILAANYAAMRTLLGLGTAAVLAVGTAANNVVQLDSGAKLPAVDASQLFNVTLRGYIAGLTLSTAGSSSTFGVSAGVAADAANSTLMPLATAYTKTTAAWVVGSGNGALDTGTIANNTWYHAFEMRRSDTGVVDICVSLSPTSPTRAGSPIPAAYDQVRRIGSLLTDASAHWVKFSQNGDEFLWDVPAGDVNTATLSTTPTNFALTVPSGVKVIAKIRGFVTNATNANAAVLVNSLDEAVAVANTPTGNFTAIINAATTFAGYVENVRTDTSRQIRAVSTQAATTLTAATVGFIDRRGRDA